MHMYTFHKASNFLFGTLTIKKKKRAAQRMSLLPLRGLRGPDVCILAPACKEEVISVFQTHNRVAMEQPYCCAMAHPLIP